MRLFFVCVCIVFFVLFAAGIIGAFLFCYDIDGFGVINDMDGFSVVPAFAVNSPVESFVAYYFNIRGME